MRVFVVLVAVPVVVAFAVATVAASVVLSARLDPVVVAAVAVAVLDLQEILDWDSWCMKSDKRVQMNKIQCNTWPDCHI